MSGTYYAFTDGELSLLEKQKAEWQDADRKQRGVIATKVYEQFKKDNPGWDDGTKKQKKHGVHWWFHNFGRKRASRERFDAVKRWNARMVVGIERENELHDRIRGASKAAAGSEAYFSCYQRELTNIWDKLSDKERDHAASVAARWNKLGPPPEQQLRTAEKHGFKYVRSFCRQMKTSCGMDCLVFTSHANKDGKVEIQEHEYMAELGGKSFFNSCKNWREGDILVSLKKHAVDMYGTDDVNAENSGTHVTRKPYISMDCDEDGHPQLPAREEWPGRTQDRKAVIRAFVATAYRRATGSTKSFVPWLNILEDQEGFIDDEYLPPDFILQEPSRMKEQQVMDILLFWINRQDSGNIPFRFKAYRLKHGDFQPSHEGIPTCNGKRRRGDEDMSSEDEAPTAKRSKKGPRKGNAPTATSRKKRRSRSGAAKGKGKARTKTPDETESGEDFGPLDVESDAGWEADTGGKEARTTTPPATQTYPKSCLKSSNSGNDGSSKSPAVKPSNSRQATPGTSRPRPESKQSRAREEDKEEDEDGCMDSEIPPGARFGPPVKKRKVTGAVSSAKGVDPITKIIKAGVSPVHSKSNAVQTPIGARPKAPPTGNPDLTPAPTDIRHHASKQGVGIGKKGPTATRPPLTRTDEIQPSRIKPRPITRSMAKPSETAPDSTAKAEWTGKSGVQKR